ncbi:uncharacterized protein TNCV_2800061 [Trichonephila clavipes]|nr:uncharacterized protein TNCV_2800061 [Trichonephila clavipes]
MTQRGSDETHFWLNGYVNKQNCRIWSEANPQVYVETPLHPEKLTVWCALWVGGIIGPYFFKNDESHNVTAQTYEDGASQLQLRAAKKRNFRNISESAGAERHGEADEHLRIVHLCIKGQKEKERLITCDRQHSSQFACVGAWKGDIRPCDKFNKKAVAAPICVQSLRHSQKISTSDSKWQQGTHQLTHNLKKRLPTTSTEKRSNGTQTYWRCITVALNDRKTNLLVSFRNPNSVYVYEEGVVSVKQHTNPTRAQLLGDGKSLIENTYQVDILLVR